MAVSINDVQRMYVAYFGRPGDPLGVDFWVNGNSLDEISHAFSTSPEYVTAFGALNTSQTVTAIYQNLFSRPPEPAGLTYWSNLINNGTISVGDAAREIATNTGPDDKIRLDNKLLAAGSFTTAVDTTAEINAYSSASAFATAKAWLAPVIDTATLTAAKATQDATIAAITAEGGGGGTTGEIFTLTVNADTLAPNSSIKTTAFDDTIRAVTAGSLQTFDSINAGDGNDTMNVAPGALVSGAVPILKSIETINFTSDAVETIGLADSSGINFINVTSTGGASNLRLNDASLATTFGTGLSTAFGTIDINILASTTGTNDTLKLALGNNNANWATVKSTDDFASIETITVAANGSHSGTSVTGNNVADNLDISAFTGLKTLTVSGNGNSTIWAPSANLATVDAANANGNNTYIVQGALAKTVTTGSGNDTVWTGAGNDTINTGAGSDTIHAGAGTNTYNGGLGADTYTGGGTDKFSVQTSTIEDGGYDIVLAAGFTTAVDSLQFVGGPAGSATNYAESTTAGTGFVTARSAALNSLTGDAALKYVAIQDAGGNTFVFYDGNGDQALTTNGSDFAILLTGVALAGIAFGDIVA